MTAAEPGIVRQYADAWLAGDLATMFDLYDDDVVVHYGGSSAYAGTHHGKQRLIEVLIETASRSDRKLVDVDAVYDEGDHGAIFVTESFHVGDATVVLPRALRYRVAGDRIVECWLYDHQQQLVDEAWGQPPSS
jgi:ketosteroid isomerase-like protein